MQKHAEMVIALSYIQCLESRIPGEVGAAEAVVVSHSAMPVALEKRKQCSGKKDRFDVALAGGVLVVVQVRVEPRWSHSTWI